MANIKKIRVGTTDFDVEDSSARTSLDGKEDSTNKTSALSGESTDTQYPTAKATYDQIEGAKVSMTVQSQILKISNVGGGGGSGYDWPNGYAHSVNINTSEAGEST